MSIVSFIFIATYGPALCWALYAALVQAQKFQQLKVEKRNGSERVMTAGFFWISVVNVWYMHTILVASLEQLYSGGGVDYSNAAQIYVTTTLLLGGFGSCTVSWFVLSEHARKILGAIKRGDTDGHEFDFGAKKNQTILGLKYAC